MGSQGDEGVAAGGPRAPGRSAISFMPAPAKKLPGPLVVGSDALRDAEELRPIEGAAPPSEPLGSMIGRSPDLEQSLAS